jgi:uncharacterized protein YggE
MDKISSNFLCGGSAWGKIIMSILLVALAVYVAALATNAIKANKYVGRDAAALSTITVSGDGDVSAKPDLAVMDFSVVSEAKTVAEAMADNTKKMNAIIDVTKSMGVAEKDLQTTGFNISPRYDYVKETATTPVPAISVSGSGGVPVPIDNSIYYPSGKRVLAGYDITQTLTVKMRDMTKIGQIIEEVTASGANQVGDLQFTIDDPDTVQAQARQKAIDNAKSKAQVLAKQLGVKLTRITSFSEGGYYPAPVRMSYAAKDTAAGEAAVTPSIQTGENKITVNVSITYEIE